MTLWSIIYSIFILQLTATNNRICLQKLIVRDQISTVHIKITDD